MQDVILDLDPSCYLSMTDPLCVIGTARCAHLKYTTDLPGKEILVHVDCLCATGGDFLQAVALVRSIVCLKAATAENHRSW